MKLKKIFIGYAVAYTFFNVSKKAYNIIKSEELKNVIDDITDIIKSDDRDDLRPSADMYNVTEEEQNE